MEVKDLAGLSKPLTKLIETVGAGFGRVSDGFSRVVNAYLLSSRDSKNEAERIKLVETAKTEAIAERVQSLAALSKGFLPQSQSIDISGEIISAKWAAPSPEVAALNERANARLAYQNTFRQLNLESVIAKAAEELESETDVDSEPVDQDWITRFFNLAQDVSNEEMQLLWARILSGEIKKSGSFSPRTLQFLSTLTRQEAILFQQVCKCLWTLGDGTVETMLISYDYSDLLYNIFKSGDLAHLGSIGLISFQTSGYALENNPATLIYHGSKIEVHSPHNIIETGYVEITQLGKEIASICGPVYDAAIYEKAIQCWSAKGYEVTCSYPQDEQLNNKTV